jgi:CubicO group peptidase (beta-lactamase class C family)
MKNYLLSCILFCLCPAVLFGQQVDSIPARLDEYLESLSKAYKFSGSVLIAQGGKILFKKGYGWKNVAATTKNDENGIYQIGSMTKIFTAAIILTLEEHGRLSVRNKLSKYFPDYRQAAEVTIENLLTHTSGIADYNVDETDTIAWTPVSKAVIWSLFRDKPLHFMPGTAYEYSNSGYFLLGQIIEQVTGRPFEQAVREMIFEPLKMVHSGFDFLHLADTLKVTGYAVYRADRQRPAHLIDSTVSNSAGGMYSNLSDLYIWARSISGHQILSAETWKKAFTPFTMALKHLGRSPSNYGYGWLIDSINGKKYVGHSGGIMGFTSYFLYFPAEDINIILLNNFLDEEQPSMLPVQDITAILFNKPYTLYRDTKEVKLADAVLGSYTGTYALSIAPKRTITVSLNNGHLQANMSGTTLEFVFQDDQHFTFKNVPGTEGVFNVENGKVIKMVILQNGRYEWNKMNDLSGHLQAQNNSDSSDDAIAQRLDTYLQSACKAFKFNGSALVAKKGKILLQKGYGVKNKNLYTGNDSNGIYMICSATKSFTATVILKLQEQGKLSIYDPLNKYFPGYPRGDEILLQHLLSHESGIHNYTEDIGPEDSTLVGNPVTRQQVMDVFYNKPLAFKPGSKFSYCNSGYFLLGMIIEKVTGITYQQVIREMIFDPLGMTHSGFDFIHLQDSSKTTGYELLNANTQTPAHLWDSTVTFAAGSIYSTVGDMYKWIKGVASGQILSKDSWKMAFTPHLNHYGYGWWIDSLYGRKYITHSGGVPGFMSNIIYFPDEDVTIILLNNFGNYGESLLPVNLGLSAILFNNVTLTWQKRDEIKVDKTILKGYTGEYSFDDKAKIFITWKHGLFQAQGNSGTDLPKLSLHAESENKFFLKEVDIEFEFVRDSFGKVIRFQLHQNGKTTEWKRSK